MILNILKYKLKIYINKHNKLKSIFSGNIVSTSALFNVILKISQQIKINVYLNMKYILTTYL